MDNGFQLAQFNIARLSAPLDAPSMKEFVDFLAPVNRFAEESPGFVWRLTAPDGASSSYLPSPYEDAMIVPNMSVWTDIESLRSFVYQTVHAYFLKSRKKWFEKLTDTQVVLWWVPNGHLPTVEEGKQKLQQLLEHGPSPEAFTFQDAFDPAGNQLTRRPGDA